MSQIKYEVQFLFGLLTDHKQQLFSEKITHRTNYFTFVLEGLSRVDNASAIMRSADIFGFQDVHVIQSPEVYKHKPIASISKGADKWLTTNTYLSEENGIATCLQELRKQGYAILGVSPHHQSFPLTDLSCINKTAFVLGNEKDGLSKLALESVDGFVQIPMLGFSESLNVSVTAGILMYSLRQQLDKDGGFWQFNEEERWGILKEWALRTLPNGNAILANWLKKLEK